MQKIIFLADSFWDIKESLKILQSDWLTAFLHLTWETDFPQACGFNRIIKVIMVHNLRPKDLQINQF